MIKEIALWCLIVLAMGSLGFLNALVFHNDPRMWTYTLQISLLLLTVVLFFTKQFDQRVIIGLAGFDTLLSYA